MDQIIKFKLIFVFLTLSATALGSSIDFSKSALSIQAGKYEFSNFSGNEDGPSTVPQPKPEVTSFHIHSEIRYRYCLTNVISKMSNPSTQNSTEVVFQVILPDSAFISKFLMEIDGKFYEAYVKEKEKAKQDYSEAKQRGQSAGLVEINARDSNIFNVSVNVKAKANITFNLTYEELLTRKLGRYEHAISVNSEEVSQIKDYKISVNLLESQNISLLKVPNLRNDLQVDLDKEGNNTDVIIRRPTGKSANIYWSPSQRDQIRMIEQGIRGKFIVQYDIDRESDAGEILLMNGYFVHFFAPQNILPLRKHAIFVLDISGSMVGRKIEQLKSAMLFVLDDLKPDDYFNILPFSSSVSVWSPSKSKRTPKHLKRVPLLANEFNIRKARQFVNKISPNGGTNINAALREALSICEAVKPGSTLNQNRLQWSRRSTDYETSYDEDDENEVIPSLKLPPNVESTIIFLTDGEPTIGLTNPESIITSIKEANANLLVPIFSLAFGNSADFNFVKKLALQNRGFGRKIYEASDADIQLKGFYTEISSPLLSNISFQYTSDKYTVTKLTIKKFPAIFEGAEIAIAGRIKRKIIDVIGGDGGGDEFTTTTKSSLADVIIPIIAIDVGANGRDGRVSYNQYDVFENDLGIVAPNSTTFTPETPRDIMTIAKHEEPKEAEDIFLERLWAYLTIKQLIEKSDAQEKLEYVDDHVVVDNDTSESKEDENEIDTEGKTAKPKLPHIPKPDEGPKARALRLALKYGFVTPLTSLIVVKPNDTNEIPRVGDSSANLVKAQVSPVPSPLIPASPLSMGHGHGYGSKMSNQMTSSRYPTNSADGLTRVRSRSSLSTSSKSSRGRWPMYTAGVRSEGEGYSDESRTITLLVESDSSSEDSETENLQLQSNIRRPATKGYSDGLSETIPQGFGNPRSSANTTYFGLSYDSLKSKSNSLTGFDSAKNVWDLHWYHRGMNFILVNETRYEIDKSTSTHLERIAPFECQIQKNTSTSDVTLGECKHINLCILNEFISDINVYLNTYFCPLQNGYGNKYAGVCCPKNSRTSA